jgi:hypothetical protein
LGHCRPEAEITAMNSLVGAGFPLAQIGAALALVVGMKSSTSAKHRTMARRLAFVAAGVGLLALSAPAVADKGPIHSSGRIGIGLGSGTIANGLSGKYYTGAKFAFQANLGTVGGRGGDKFKDNGGIAVSLDGLIENGPITTTEHFSLDWSYGLGVGVGLKDDNSAIAVAGILGLELNFTVVPVDLVLEYRPNLAVDPDVDLELVDFSGHLRYYFK